MIKPENDNRVGSSEFVRRLHVIPVGDREIHAAQESCWCHPAHTGSNVWVHNAKDCREARERATGEKCSEGWINIAECIMPEVTYRLVPVLSFERRMINAPAICSTCRAQYVSPTTGLVWNECHCGGELKAA